MEVAIVNVTIQFTWDEGRYRECSINGHTVVMRLRDRMVDLTHLAMVAGKTNGWVTGKLSGIKKSEKDAYCLRGPAGLPLSVMS